MEVDLTEKLIEAVKKRPVVYLKRHPYYRNKIWKLQAWREIEQELNNDGTYLKKQWKSLKTTYKQYKRYQRIADSSPSPHGVKYSDWMWGQHMSFLDENYVAVTQDPLIATQSSSQTFEANVEDSVNSTTSDTSISPPHREETVEIEPSPGPSSALVENIRKRHSSERIIESDPSTDEKEENQEGRTMRNIQESPSTFDSSCKGETVKVKCDGVDLFFLGYADAYKSLSGRNKLMVQYEIGKILTMAELGVISES